MKNVSEGRASFNVLESSEATQTATMRLKRGEESGPLGNEHAQSAQVLFVVRGAVTATVGDKTFRMEPGDSVVVEKGVVHRFVGASSEEALTFNVYSPPAY